MKMNHDFSVAICVYGGDNPQFFDDALSSIFTQTLMPNEVVLQVDGPINEELESVIKKYCSLYSFLKVFRLDKNYGHGIARNESVKNCSNEIIAIADADDINCPNRFERQMKHFIDNPSLCACSSACYHFSKSTDVIINEEKMPLCDNDIKKYMKRRCPLCQASTMFRRQAVLDAGGYLDWYHAEDYYLWIRMYLNGAVFENDEESLIYVRTTEEQSKRRGGIKYFRSLKKLYRFMLDNRVINIFDYLFNVSTRFIIQILMPAKIRAVLRKLFQ